MGILSDIYRCVRHIKAEEGYRKVSEWQLAKDVECADGQTVEEKVGGIKGITTATNVTETGYAADATVLNKLLEQLGDQITFSQSGSTLNIIYKG